jgi:hypothetical protein
LVSIRQSISMLVVSMDSTENTGHLYAGLAFRNFLGSEIWPINISRKKLVLLRKMITIFFYFRNSLIQIYKGHKFQDYTGTQLRHFKKVSYLNTSLIESQ